MTPDARGNFRLSLPAILVGIVILAILAAWYFKLIPSRTAPATSPSTSTRALGSTIYNKISNPVSGVLPATLAPIPNPADSFYVNPFKR